MRPVDPFDDASTARAVIDDRGAVARWGVGARRLLGYEAHEVLGRPAAALLAERDALAALVGPRWSGDLTLRHRDGRTVPVHLLALRRPPLGDRADWRVVVRPDHAELDPPDDVVTAAALDQSPCPMLVCDERLRLRWINGRMAELISLPDHEVRGLRITDIGVRSENAEVEELLAEVLATGRARDIERYVRPSGFNRAAGMLTRIAPLTDGSGRVRGACLTGHDFTEHYLARERLRLVNEASVRIGTTLDVTCTAQELADVCIPALADFVSIDLLDPQESGEAPTELAAPVELRRAAHHSVDPGNPMAVMKPGHTEVYPATSPQADSVVAGRTIVALVASGRLDQWLNWNRTRGERVRSSASTPRCPYRSRPAARPSGSRSSPATGGPTPSPRTMCCWPRRSPRGPRSASTTPVGSPASARPPSPCSAVCCPVPCRARPPWRRRRVIFRRRGPGWAATGST